MPSFKVTQPPRPKKNFWQVAMVQPCLPWNLHLFVVSPSLKLRLQASQHRSLPVRWQDIIPPRGILGRKLKESDWVHQESSGMWPKLYQQAELYSIGMAHDLGLLLSRATQLRWRVPSKCQQDIVGIRRSITSNRHHRHPIDSHCIWLPLAETKHESICQVSVAGTQSWGVCSTTNVGFISVIRTFLLEEVLKSRWKWESSPSFPISPSYIRLFPICRPWIMTQVGSLGHLGPSYP